jgi:Na+-translocating ferredoxin:NAD+ oxidoreductase RnfD subunit
METTRTAEQEQRTVRVGALIVHLAALLTAAVLVAVGAYLAAFAAGVVALVAGAWALKLYNDLQAQAIQDRAMTNAAARFSAPPPHPPADRFEG